MLQGKTREIRNYELVAFLKIQLKVLPLFDSIHVYNSFPHLFLTKPHPTRSGARGLGWNMSQALAEAGAKAIALLDVKQELGDAAAAELHSTTGIPVQFYNVDVRDEKALADVTAKVTADLGSIDIVINSAGIVE